MNLITLKRSTTAGAVPASLEAGELALNLADRKLFYKDSLGTIRSIGLAIDEALSAKQPLADALTAITAIADAAAVRAGAAPGAVLTPAAVLDAMAWVALTDAATIAVDHAAGVNRTVTITANRTMGAPTNAKPGWPLNLRVKQPAAGSKTITWASAYDFGDGSAPTLSTTGNAEDLVSFVCISSAKFAFLGLKKRVD
jgi:hypothetical protein